MEKLYVENGRLMAGGAPLLLRGFGLGGWLLPEGYMWKFEELCGAEYAASFWERYYDS